MSERPTALDGLLGYVADNLPDEAEATARARAAIAPLEKAIRAAKDQERAELRSAALNEAADFYDQLLTDMGKEVQCDPRYWTAIRDVIRGLRNRASEATTTPGVVRYRKRPVEVDTIQWTGTNEADVQAFTGGPNFHALSPEDREGSDDPEATATVYDKLHSTWVLVYTGQHIVRGVKGEYYPIAEDVLAETYELPDELDPS